jgi:hypothetical protein
MPNKTIHPGFYFGLKPGGSIGHGPFSGLWQPMPHVRGQYTHWAWSLAANTVGTCTMAPVPAAETH